MALFEIHGGADAFRLALFTDLHLDAYCGQRRTFYWLKRNLREIPADCVALLGDSALLPLYWLRTRRLMHTLRRHGKVWTAVLGNHEGEHFGELSRKRTLQTYAKTPNFCGNVTLDAVPGYGNHAILAYAGDTPVQLLVFFDSGGGRRGIDGIQPAQVDWYIACTKEAALRCGRVIPSTLFMHVPVHAYKEAASAAHAQWLDGALREKICTVGAPAQSARLVTAAKENGGRAFVCGHDHANDFDIFYDGIHYIYAQSGGYSKLCYDARSRGVRGCTVLSFGADGAANVTRRRNTG